jgi:DNA-directed RNA polymerase sigma subunit (sigma70/sigma32)
MRLMNTAVKLNRMHEINKMREAGLTLQKIGETHGISRERVRQILAYFQRVHRRRRFIRDDLKCFCGLVVK